MSTSLPTISIILPTFNGSAFIQKAISSCLDQTFPNFELIIVDDGSTDDTSAKIKAFKDDRIRVIHSEQNQGHIAALNTGFALSRGEFLTWTSDDNYYSQDALEVMVQELNKNSDTDFVYTRYQVIDSNGNNMKLGRSENPDYLDVDNCVGGCFLYTRKVYEAIGNFNPDAFLAEDYEYWLRVRNKFQMKKMDAVLYFYREHPKSLTGVHREEKVQEQVQKIRNRFIPQWKRLLRRVKEKLGV